ncbi:MAG TPA: carbon storage regulator [Myxococcales bacterium]|nr:carbon storage regulator [Myxococcales bacterium]HBU49448.1 carbon storage regulator [Myxococcales bacterium]|tara:strand:+ start:1693 stop:1980 length:288 start_codon:yes stop_codon:yes gene_type:complete
MLTLSRRVGAAIRIGDDIRIVVTEIRGSSVRLGIEAPRHCQVFREELWVKIQEENRAAAEAALSTDLDIDALGALMEAHQQKESSPHGQPGEEDD